MIPDRNERTQALDTGRSFAIAAPAGSGKTGLLTQRMLSLLAKCERPEAILCMTFTRKAAAEMRLRIGKALALGSQIKPPADEYEHQNWQLARRVVERDQAMNWQLMSSPNRLQITTIDSFCRLLAQQFATESGLGMVPENTETPATLYREATRDLFTELEAPGRTGEALATLLQHLDNNHRQVEDLLIELLGRREQWLAHVVSNQDAREYLESALVRLITETLSKVQQTLIPFHAELTSLLDYIRLHLTSDENNLQTRWLDCTASELASNTAGGLQFWQALSLTFLTNKGSWRKKANKNIGLPTREDSRLPEQAEDHKQRWKALIEAFQQRSGLLDLLNDVLNLPTPTYDDSQWEALDALTHLLPRLVARLQLTFQRENISDFTETALAAQRALGSVGNAAYLQGDAPTDLALRLDYRIQHILVDECQDTSSLQFDLLRRLTAGWQTGDGRTLFLVGDAMQSLYGFRNANVGLFLDSRRHPIGDINLRALDLSTNFRSRAAIIDWVNRVFTKAFPDVEDSARGATPYVVSSTPGPEELTEATADKDEFEDCDEQPAVTLDTFDPDAPDREEGEQVALRVLASQKHQPEGNIAILVRGRSHLKDILPALYRHNLSWQAADIDSLGGRMPVIDLMSLTRALLCPADRVAWLSLLRAPWSGLNHRDLHTIATWQGAPANPEQELTVAKRGSKAVAYPGNSEHSLPLLINQLLSPTLPQHLSDEGGQIVRRLAETLSPAWQHRHRKPLRTWIEGIWISLGGPAALLDSAALQQCRQYFDVLETHSSQAIAEWSAFVELVDRGNIAARPDADPRLQILTIHKAKGLEFDTVIIPGLHRQKKSNQKELLLWREQLTASGQTDLIMSPPSSTGEDADRIYQYLRREQRLKARLEDARVLYVACTRAKSHLHLFFKRPRNGVPANNTPLALLWDALSEDLGEASTEQPTPTPGPLARVTHHSAARPKELSGEEVLSAATLSHGVRLPPHWSLERDGRIKLTPSAAREDNEAGRSNAPRQSISAPRPSPPGEQGARLAGTLFHRTARQIVLEGAERWTKSRINRQKKVWLCELSGLPVEHSNDDCTRDELVARLERAVTKMLGHTEGKWLLSPHPEHTCEWSLGYIDDTGQVRTAILDRSFIADGERWIVDYKFTEPDAEQTLAEFLQAQRAKYREQLNHYRNLLENGEASIVKTALYFPLIPHLELL